VEDQGRQPAVDRIREWIEELKARERRIEQREQAVHEREMAADERDRKADERELDDGERRREADDRDRKADRRELVADERDRMADRRELWPEKPKPPDDEPGEDAPLLAWQRQMLEVLRRSRTRMAETAVALHRSDGLIARTRAQQRANERQQAGGGTDPRPDIADGDREQRRTQDNGRAAGS
jgi:uncharacterized protein (DUF3084 family)